MKSVQCLVGTTVTRLFAWWAQLGRTSDPSLVRRNLYVARLAYSRLKCQLTGLIVARSRPTSPGVCLRWLPVWLPEIG